MRPFPRLRSCLSRFARSAPANPRPDLVEPGQDWYHAPEWQDAEHLAEEQATALTPAPIEVAPLKQECYGKHFHFMELLAGWSRKSKSTSDADVGRTP